MSSKSAFTSYYHFTAIGFIDVFGLGDQAMKTGTGGRIFILCIAVAPPIMRVGSLGEPAAMRLVPQGPPPGPLKF